MVPSSNANLEDKNEQNGDNFFAFLSSQVDNVIAWRDPWFLRSAIARQIDDGERPHKSDAKCVPSIPGTFE